MNYYPRHLGDYARDTGHLTMAEHGAYNLLIDYYYANEKPIPDGDRYRICRARTPQERVVVDNVLSEFFTASGRGSADFVWTHKKCDQVIAESREKSEKAKASAQSRWNAKAMRSHCEGNAIQDPITNNQEEKAKDHPLPLKGDAFVLPDKVDAQAWADFDKHRTTLNRKTWTPQAKKKTADLLAKYPASTQREMVDTSIRNGWRGIFAPKGPTPDDDRPEWMRGVINMPRSST